MSSGEPGDLLYACSSTMKQLSIEFCLARNDYKIKFGYIFTFCWALPDFGVTLASCAYYIAYSMTDFIVIANPTTTRHTQKLKRSSITFENDISAYTSYLTKDNGGLTPLGLLWAFEEFAFNALLS